MASAVVVIVRPHSVLVDVGLSVAVALGFALIALWLCVMFRPPSATGESDGGIGADGGGGPDDPRGPELPAGGPVVWPELERELRAYLEAHERSSVSA